MEAPTAPPAGPSPPRRSPPPLRPFRTLGVLTVLYGLLLLLYGGLSAALVVGFPHLSRLLSEVQGQQQASLDARREGALKQLEEAEQKAASPEEKANIRVERILLERRREPGIPMTGVGLGIFNPPEVRQFIWAQTITMALVNVLLTLSGFGLMGRKNWGRKLALFVSSVKFPLLIGFAAWAIWKVSPLMADAWSSDLAAMMQSMYSGASPSEEAQAQWAGYRGSMERVFSTLLALYAGFGMIFPAVLLYVLNRPKVVAEFTGRPV